MLEEVNNDRKLKLIKLSIVFAPILIAVVIMLAVFTQNEYKSIESEMEKQAKKYVADNALVVDSQIFIGSQQLGIVEGIELCSKASGVVVTNVSGKLEYSAYLKCVDYESDIINNSNRYIELNGPEVVLVNKGTMYFDEGYTKIKEVEVEQVGQVLTTKGAYTINYVIKVDGKQKGVVKRIVIVSDVDTSYTISGLTDKEIPIISLKGEKEMSIILNRKYTEPGYTSYDYKDGKISRKVKVEGKVDSSKIGSYTLTYKVTNSNNTSYSVERVVHVVEKIADLTINISNKEGESSTNAVTININVLGEGYEKMTLPDGSTTVFRYSSYIAKSNGIYTFKILDEYGNVIHKSIEITNIDNVPPTGSCTASISQGKTIITASATDEHGVEAVDYIIDDKETGFFKATTYTYDGIAKKVDAVFKDVAGNTAKASCLVENKKVYTFNYVPIANISTKSLISCKTYAEADRIRLEALMASAVNEAGYGTRAGVVEAARFLVGGLDYRIPYLGPKNKDTDPDAILGRYGKGLNIGYTNGWGCSVHGWTQGMDCTNFVSWAFKNGGVEMKGGIYSTSNTHKSAEVADQIQVGDFMLNPCGNSCKFDSKYSHIGIVIGVDDTKIYVAEAKSESGIGSIVVTEWEKSNLPKEGSFSVVRFYPYESDGNVTNMWN